MKNDESVRTLDKPAASPDASATTFLYVWCVEDARRGPAQIMAMRNNVPMALASSDLHEAVNMTSAAQAACNQHKVEVALRVFRCDDKPMFELRPKLVISMDG